MIGLHTPGVTSDEIHDASAIGRALLTAADANAAAALLPGVPLEGGLITENLTVQGSTTLGDASGDTLTVSGGITASQATSVDPAAVANVGTLDGRYLPRVANAGSTAALAMAMAAFPARSFGTTYQFANVGWSNWFLDLGSTWAQLRKQQASSSAPSWARAGIYNFLLNTGESNATPAGKGFSFSCAANLPGDSAAIGMATDFYFGAQLNEQGGALTGRGLRARIAGNSPTSAYTVTAAVHNGNAEQSTSANTGHSFNGALIIRWLPTASTPGVGSLLQVWGRARGAAAPTLIVEHSLTEAFTANSMAGSGFAVVASSTGTTPGYTTNWELGGIATYEH